MKNRRWTAGAVVVAIAGVAWACGSDAVEDLGDAMVDAGVALRDAASDAAAAQVAAECTIDEGGTLFAEAAIDVDPATVTDARAILCDLEGTAPFGLGGLDCTSGTVRFDATRARVQCGSGDPTGSGYRWRSVRIFIE